MGLQEHTLQILQVLFDGYLDNPGGLMDITEEIKAVGYDPHEFGKHLVDGGYVKNQQYRPLSFVCSITDRGIEKVAPNYYRDIVDKVISTIGTLGFGRQSIMEVLDFEPKDFQRAHNIAKYLESHGITQRSQYVHNDVIIELTLLAQDRYNNAFDV